MQRNAISSPFSNTPSRRHSLFVLGLLLFALFLRFYDLEIRPPHHDEGVNGWFVDNILEGQKYQYNPEHYHGPTFFYLGWAFAHAFGLSAQTLRFIPALFGLLLCFSPLMLQRKWGKWGVSAAIIALAMTPANLFYSRYAIHEMTFICLVTFAGLSLYRYFFDKKLVYLFVFVFAMANAAATKETVVLHVFGITVGLAAAILLGKEGHISLLKKGFQPFRTFWAIFFFVCILVVWFKPAGFVAFIKSYFFYEELASSRHTKSWTYFLNLLLRTEFYLLILGALGVWVAAVHRRSLDLFLCGWALSLITIHSLIGYKTPWLIINLTVPLAFMVGVFINHLDQKKIKNFPLWITMFLVFSFVSLVYSVNLSFRYFKEEKNPYCYSHTLPNAMLMFDRIKGLLNENKTVKVDIVSPEYWPMPLTLHPNKKQVLYWGKMIDDINQRIVLGQPSQKEEIESKIKYDFILEKYELRPGVKLDLYIAKDLLL